ncbi:MAG: extracellular solute-binding protein [Lachnospiraceae bacterium]|nr:extracellular solute-binding protein [Lachnospiraceae bacterium]
MGERTSENRGRFLAKRFILVILACLLACCFSACGSGSNRKKGPETGDRILKLALREGTYADVIVSCLDKFERENHIYCEIYEYNEDELHSRVATNALKNKGEFDLCMVDGSWMSEFIANGVLANLSDLGYELDNDIIPATTAVSYHDGDVYLAPYFGNVTVLLYNKILVHAAGYEKEDINDLNDIMEICLDAKEHKSRGFMYRGDTENNIVVDFLPILLSFGGWVVDEDGNPTIDNDKFREAVNYYLKLIDTGESAGKDDLVMAIANGGAAMGVGWPGWYMVKKNSSADYMAFTGKATDESTAYNANVYGIWTLGIAGNSPDKELAIELLEYLMDSSVQKSTIDIGGVPCRYSSLRDREILEKYPQYAAVCDALETGVYRPFIQNWTEFYTILGNYLRDIIKGDLTAEEGLKRAQKDLEALKAAQ